MSDIQVGDTVKWNWGAGTGTGQVRKRFTADITRSIKGTEVKRNASEGCPAHLIEQEDGNEVLKSASEIEKA